VDVDSATQKIWMTFQALGNIAFAYSYTIILIEIQVRKAAYTLTLMASNT